MPKKFDVQIKFDLPIFKLLFTELFFKKLEKPLRVNFEITDSPKEKIYKDLVYSSRWISINLFESYFENRFWKRNHTQFSGFLFTFFEYLFQDMKIVRDNKYLLKIYFFSKNGQKLCFLFDEIYSLNYLKNNFSEIISKVQEYRKKEIEITKEIKKAFKLKSQEIYFELKNNKWAIINLLYNAGKYHHDSIAENIYDNRIAKPDILVNREKLNDTIKYKALWQIEVDKIKFVRIKPNDIALYSNISISNLNKAKAIYNNKDSTLWKYIQLHEEEKELMDYYELIITSIILAYSSIEALINIVIPRNYFHKKRVLNKNTGRLITKKFSKNDIERWYTMNDKMNIVIPDALGLALPNQQKWWNRFDKLKILRDKIVHAVESKSNERYSDLLKKDIFIIVESHIEVIKYFGKWATDSKHYLLNELPYGFGYDDIMPILISSNDYNRVDREMRGIR